MVPGLIGQIQAIEVVKIIIGKGDVLSQRMIIFDALGMSFRNVKIRGRNPKCVVCGNNPEITDVSKFDYDAFCQIKCDYLASIKLPAECNMHIEDFQKVK